MRLASLLAFLGLSTFTVLSAVACGGTSADDPASDPANTADGSDEEVKAAVIGEESNGKTVDVALGRSFTIALSENASTGYSWMVKSVDKTLGQPKTTMIPGDVHRPGAPGTKKLTWSTKSPLDLVGKHEITLILQRPWAETSPPAKTFKVTINITDVAKASTCGGLRGEMCSDKGQYCDFSAAASCGMADQTGKCQTKPEFCPEVFMPVCGCNGKDYSNGCFANAAGTSVAHAGNCAK
jgi:predicted secreted protein